MRIGFREEIFGEEFWEVISEILSFTLLKKSEEFSLTFKKVLANFSFTAGILTEGIESNEGVTFFFEDLCLYQE